MYVGGKTHLPRYMGIMVWKQKALMVRCWNGQG